MLGWLWIGACRPAVESPPPEPETPAVEVAELRFDGAPPTRLLVLSLDTTRRDAVGRYGEGPSATPFLDARLGESVVLDNHRSCSNWTGPSMLCATSGVDPVDIGAMRPNDALNRLPTLARVLGEAGYATRLVSANPFFFGPDDALGFDDVTVLVDDAGRAEGVAARLRADLDALRDGPRWYAHAHFFDPHDPYCPPEAYLDGLPPIPFDVCTDPSAAEFAMWTNGTDEQRKTYVAHLRFRFRAELRYFDDTLAALWADLDARGDLDDTLVVFFTDHGEQFYERGTLGHSHELFAEETAAVAAFWAKNLTPAAVTLPTVHQDLAATIYAVFGALPQTTGSGRRLSEVTAGRTLGLVDVLQRFNTIAVVTHGQQLTLGYDDFRSFHDTTADPAMTESRYDPDDPDVLRAWSEMDAFLDRVEVAFPGWLPHDREP